jgi:DNA repair exonuclease SbcCD ATPase subunit
MWRYPMNNIQELIERLNRLLDEDDDSVDDIWERTIYDSITSLKSMQAPLPDKVERLLKELTISQLSATADPLYKKAHDLIERLWREKQGYYSNVKRLELAAENHYAMLDEYRQHIEELEGDLMTCKQTRGAAISREKEAAQNMSAIANENKRLDAALEEISLGVVAPMDFARKARAGE